MSHLNNNTESKKNKYLTERNRYDIETLLREHLRPTEIAKRLDKHVRTIEREIKRGKVRLLNTDLSCREEYCADKGHLVYLQNSRNKGRELKIGKDHKLAKHIEDKIIKHKYSPDAVIGEIKVKGLVFDASICTKTLYNYIDKEVFVNITNKDLPVKRNKKKGKYKKVKRSIALNNIKGTSIEQRPPEVETRHEYGHWEMDCVVGKKDGRAALLVLTERQRREEIIYKIPSKSQESVLKVIDSIEKRYGKGFKDKFKTITVDNGSEFLDFESLERSLQRPGEQRVKIYYAHPYSSCERGTNENANKLIRRFIPKGTDIARISKAKIKYIETWINNYPRKIFGYKSANEMATN